MKLIHTSDWHLGQTLRNHERADEHRHFISQLCQIAAQEHPDAIIVSGDIFDSPLPQVSVQRDFVDYVLQLQRVVPSTPIIITAGNHDSGTRLNVHRPIWRNLGIHTIGACDRNEDGTFDPSELIVEVPGKCIVITAPYFHPRNYPAAEAGLPTEERQRRFFAYLLDQAAIVDAGRNLPVILMAHLAVEGSDISCHKQTSIGGMKTERADELGHGFDYVALGHIHRPQTLSTGPGAMRYSGSPFAMSFSEEFDHSVTIVEISSHGAAPVIRESFIKPLRHVANVYAPDGTFESALAMCCAMPDDDESYVRILVDPQAVLPPGVMNTAEQALKHKKLRLCNIENKVSDSVAAAKAVEKQGMNVDELQSISPMQLAQIIYKDLNNGTDMPTDLIELLQQVIPS